VGSGIFKSAKPEKFARAIVEATRHFDKPAVVARVSEGLGDSMKGKDIRTLTENEKMQHRGK
jgi:pyridoxal 5'-phosphate synthase pdxS subunit